MTVINALKKLERLSGIVPIKENNEYYVIYKNNVISFIIGNCDSNGRELVFSYHVRSVDDVSDVRRDYFAGVFYDNLTQLFKHI